MNMKPEEIISNYSETFGEVSDNKSDKLTLSKAKAYIATYKQDNERLHEQLAASQAREQQLRAAISYINHSMNQALLPGNDKHRELILSQSMSGQALTVQSDTTALETMIAKAGEVMREKCIPASFKQFLSDVHTAAGLLRYGKKDQGLADRLGKGVINYMTQTVRTVTLDDLK